MTVSLLGLSTNDLIAVRNNFFNVLEDYGSKPSVSEADTLYNRQNPK